MSRLVFKYRGDFIDSNGEHRDIKDLLEQRIYVPRINELNDPYEKEYLDGTAMAVNWANAMKVAIGEHAEWPNWRDNHIELIGRYCGIYSLSMSNEDGVPTNELLWAHYANSHKGFCIVYDWDEMCKYYSQDKVVPIEIQYKEKPPILFANTDEERIKRAFGCKSLAWAYEQEFRLLFTNEERIFKINTYNCPSKLVKAIYLGLRISNESRELLLEYGRKNKVPIYQMKHPHDSYKFDAELIQNI